MSSLNKVQLIGHLGRDPEVRYTTSGTAIANINLATSERYKDSSGQQQESTEWHRIVAFARRAEVMAEYLRKGSKVYIEGRIQTRKWQDQNGHDRYTTEIVANDFIFLDTKPSSGGTADNRQAPPEASTPQEGGEQGGGQQDWDQDFEDNIPFVSMGYTSSVRRRFRAKW